MGFFSRRKRGYQAAIRVERYRAAAEELRETDPETYQEILRQADGSEAEAAAARDPDAYVALFLAAAEDAGVIDRVDPEIEDLRETAERTDHAPASGAATANVKAGNGRGDDQLIHPLDTDSEDSEPPPLNAELFHQDAKHEAYWEVVTEVMRFGDRQAIPAIAREMSLNSLRDMLRLHGIDFERSIEDLAESFAHAYLLVNAEDWQIDSASAQRLIDGCMLNINRSRLAVGSGTVDRSDYSTWISLVLLGLHSDADEWEPLNSCVHSDGAWERLESVFPTYMMIGEHLSEPHAAELEGWRRANELAWRNGIFLSLLYRLGLLSTEAGGAASRREIARFRARCSSSTRSSTS